MRIATSIVNVGTRHRKDPDIGIQDLCRSMKRLGQLQPIVVVEDQFAPGKFTLIAGARRLRACELLCQDVDAVVAERLGDALKLLEAERDENTCRIDFTPEEAVEMGRSLEKLEGPKAKERMKAGGGDKKSAGKIGSSKLDDPIPGIGRTDEKVAASVGMGKDTYRKAKAVVAGAEADPALRPLVDQMNATGKVDPAYTAFHAGKSSPGKPPKKEFDIEDDALKFRKLRDKLSENWTTNAHCQFMRQTFTQLANEV